MLHTATRHVHPALTRIRRRPLDGCDCKVTLLRWSARAGGRRQMSLMIRTYASTELRPLWGLKQGRGGVAAGETLHAGRPHQFLIARGARVAGRWTATMTAVLSYIQYRLLLSLNVGTNALHGLFLMAPSVICILMVRTVYSLFLPCV
jgi:hypothetical protein